MNEARNKNKILLSGLIVIVILIGVVAWPVLAEPDADSVAFLPFVTSPLAPTDLYETEFEGGLGPWQLVRWQKGGSYDLDHDSGCDSGHCSFLDLDVDDAETYAIASPLILGPGPTYEIEFRAKLRDRQDKHQYGAIFGADWHSAPCPGDNTNGCFNHYYEFRVRYRDETGDKFLEYRLRRIDGHDDNNIEQGEDLIDWTRVDGVNAEDWVKWSVRYNNRGRITFKANNNELGSFAEDKKYDDPLYFGVFVRAGDNGNARARFDSFSITAEQ